MGAFAVPDLKDASVPQQPPPLPRISNSLRRFPSNADRPSHRRPRRNAHAVPCASRTPCIDTLPAPVLRRGCPRSCRSAHRATLPPRSLRCPSIVPRETKSTMLRRRPLRFRLLKRPRWFRAVLPAGTRATQSSRVKVRRPRCPRYQQSPRRSRRCTPERNSFPEMHTVRAPTPLRSHRSRQPARSRARLPS